MSKNYETVFIMTPVLSEDQAKETVSKYKDVLKEAGCKIVHEESWGLKKLAYPIQKKTTGFYHLIEFQGEGNVVADLELTFKRDEKIIRYLTVAMDKHAIAFSEKRRNKSSKKKEEVTLN